MKQINILKESQFRPGETRDEWKKRQREIMEHTEEEWRLAAPIRDDDPRPPHTSASAEPVTDWQAMRRGALTVVLDAIERLAGPGWTTAKRLVEEARTSPVLADALHSLCYRGSSARSVGWMLRREQRQIVDGRSIERASGGRPSRYRVRRQQ